MRKPCPWAPSAALCFVRDGTVAVIFAGTGHKICVGCMRGLELLQIERAAVVAEQAKKEP